MFLLSPVHALGDGVLVGAGEGGKYQVPRVGLPVRDLHLGQALVSLPDLWHIGKVQLRIDAVGDQIHGQSDDIHISGPLAVAEEGALHPVSAGQNAEFRVADAAAPVVVGMEA